MNKHHHHENIPPGSPPNADDPKTLDIRRLGDALCRRTGIKLTDQVSIKLLHVFANIPPGLLQAWVTQLEQLPHDHPEWLAVIENVTVHETYFFRDAPQLEILRRTILPRLVADAAVNGRWLKLWSAGCAAGEEVYTLTILLLETMLEMNEAAGNPETGIKPAPGWQIEVKGLDISRHIIELARQGIYRTGPLSPFRSLPSAYWRWFEEFTASEHPDLALMRVRRWLLPFTRFEQFNIMSPRPPSGGNVHLIMCRNVFIYFSPEARNAAQAMFAQAQEENGYLLLGNTDHMVLQEQYAAEWHEGGVAYRRR